MNLNKKEINRYLGYHRSLPDSITQQMINEVSDTLIKIVSPKHVFEKYPVAVQGDEVTIDQFIIKSSKLARHLRQCHWVYLFAATLGIAADNKIRAYCAVSMSKASVAQAVCTALIESYCDEIQEGLSKLELKNNCFLRPRFSPGYGDFSIEYQKELLNKLNASKRIGLTLTNSHLMVPTKSVSAMIGVTNKPNCHTNKCAACDNKECEFREDRKEHE